MIAGTLVKFNQQFLALYKLNLLNLLGSQSKES